MGRNWYAVVAMVFGLVCLIFVFTHAPGIFYAIGGVVAAIAYVLVSMSLRSRRR